MKVTIPLRAPALWLKPPLVILCDISGSMSRYSRMLLHFLHTLTGDRERVHSFVFGTRLTNVSRYLRDTDVDAALDAISDAVGDWSEAALEVLREQLGRHSERVFTFRNQPVAKANTKAWRRALLKARITDFRWHDLRHTWASYHVQQSTPENALQELGGWSNAEMVRRYAHLSARHLAEYAERSRGFRTYSATAREKAKNS